jgi:hypothetical protein
MAAAETYINSMAEASLYFPIDFSSVSEEEFLRLKNRAARMLTSILSAAQSGKDGQTVLTAVYKNGILYGHCMDLENSMTYTTKVDITMGLNLDNIQISFVPIIIESILNKWALEKNAVIAWGAIRELCDINFPDSIPSV